VNWKKAAESLPPVISGINRKGTIVGLSPAGTYAPDLDAPVRPKGFPPGSGLKY
jgi:hypothetical protein